MAMRHLGYLLGAGLVAVGAAPAWAGADVNGNFVQNGDFSTTTATSSQQITTSNVANWTTTGYNFIYLGTGATPNYDKTDSTKSVSGSQADTTGASGEAGTVKLWGPGTGVNNGLVNSPNGSNFIAADDNYRQGAISQTITGLTANAGYYLSFYWAAAQQSGFYGTTQEQWTAYFGSNTSDYTKNTKQSTSTIQLASQAFSGWYKVTMYFTATSSTQLLSFLATGTPGGDPPFSLLDGVSLVAAPEPTTWAVMIVGLLGLGGVTLMRRRSASTGGSAQA